MIITKTFSKYTKLLFYGELFHKFISFGLSFSLFEKFEKKDKLNPIENIKIL